jgi:hypothetical protein
MLTHATQTWWVRLSVIVVAGLGRLDKKEKKKKTDHFFFLVRYQVRPTHTRWATLSVVVVAGRAWWW